ncbi:TIGR02530 family flagellar biosynthesis protein [Oceanobacillus profundus]|uniref:Flagellar protein n=1 Tax=Oceanobacillus profundus TaxID=372463 RepID=A0A417YKI7_9BACI|nr:TIGR02530 family flagellar biosynthesis protein [Oceanobacillus profundus]MBR3121575.1 flagellar protein [Oceanobacillus sp.]MCM3396357.1 flagellar protein [Oceanobacillus profundus]MDO6449633.1 TIGR02530 family flagellar biosynthesis protein [Oceanobacillus profundus]RHW33636.1 flagellar protein [Oceanobacillus profundus]
MDHRIHQVPQHALQFPAINGPKSKQSPIPFKDILSQEQGLKISKHASQRIAERNIQIDEQQWEIIGEKMQEAKKKGITDSLIVMNNAALLVNAKNHTVVTAMNREEATSRIFTNINGTILIND